MVNLRDLERVFADGDEVNSTTLLEKGLIRRGPKPVKILATGDLTKKLSVSANKFSGSAQSKIEAAGGTCETVAS